jgi:HD-GYP domain-containing protein (c-di-GMP phosphodiesterase class II)
MEECIKAIRHALGVTDTNGEDNIDKDSLVFVEYLKLGIGLDKIMSLRHYHFELLDEFNLERKKYIAERLVNEIKMLRDYLNEVKTIIIRNPEHQYLLGDVIDAIDAWIGALEPILAIMGEQSQILRRHVADDIEIARLLNALMASVRKHTAMMQEQSDQANKLVVQIEIILAVLTVIVGLIIAYATLKHYASNLERAVRESSTEVFQLKTAVLETVADLVEFRDQHTGGHNGRTQKYLHILIKELIRSGVYRDEVSKWNMDFILPSAQLHDVGKIAVPDGILNKPGKLSPEERAIMQEHAVVGIDAIKRIMANTKEHAFLWHALAIVSSHHEKWDGTGYPLGLKGEVIPLEGRLMAIADVYDALVSKRPYKEAFSHEEACRIIENDSGTHFDPVLVDAFCRAQREFLRVVEENEENEENRDMFMSVANLRKQSP